jgi:hypothetical protein
VLRCIDDDPVSAQKVRATTTTVLERNFAEA